MSAKYTSTFRNNLAIIIKPTNYQMRDKKTETDLYIESKIRDESEHLKEIRKNAFQDNRIFMQLGKLECKILQMCIKMHLVKKVVEVGTLAGYSAIWMSGGS